MKLLLTSAGFRNKSIVGALKSLTGKSFNKTKLAFIPTAANVEEGDKGWLIDDLVNCKKLGFAEIDIVDFSALPEGMWTQRLKEVDVLLFGGGNTFHLMYWLNKSGLDQMLPKLLKTRVYVGISAGSMVATNSLMLSQSKFLYSMTIGKLKGNRGLDFVDFQIRPHLNSPYFPNVRIKNIEKLAKKTPSPIYAIDDNTAIKVVNEKIEVVSEGKWKRFN